MSAQNTSCYRWGSSTISGPRFWFIRYCPFLQVDSFLVEAVCLSHLQKVVIGHDGEGYGAGMYLKMVTVKESQDSDKEWVFPLWNWLDTHLGLCETVCETVTVGKLFCKTGLPGYTYIFFKLGCIFFRSLTFIENVTFHFDLTIIAQPHLVRSKFIKFRLVNEVCVDHLPFKIN